MEGSAFPASNVGSGLIPLPAPVHLDPIPNTATAPGILIEAPGNRLARRSSVQAIVASSREIEFFLAAPARRRCAGAAAAWVAADSSFESDSPNLSDERVPFQSIVVWPDDHF